MVGDHLSEIDTTVQNPPCVKVHRSLPHGGFWAAASTGPRNVIIALKLQKDLDIHRPSEVTALGRNHINVSSRICDSGCKLCWSRIKACKVSYTVHMTHMTVLADLHSVHHQDFARWFDATTVLTLTRIFFCSASGGRWG